MLMSNAYSLSLLFVEELRAESARVTEAPRRRPHEEAGGDGDQLSGSFPQGLKSCTSPGAGFSPFVKASSRTS